MKISIITATCNSGKNITNCLQSVAGQTFQNIEHIVVDGGSTDKTLEIVKSCSSVSKFISESEKVFMMPSTKASNAPPEI